MTRWILDLVFECVSMLRFSVQVGQTWSLCFRVKDWESLPSIRWFLDGVKESFGIFKLLKTLMLFQILHLRLIQWIDLNWKGNCWFLRVNSLDPYVMNEQPYNLRYFLQKSLELCERCTQVTPKFLKC